MIFQFLIDKFNLNIFLNSTINTMENKTCLITGATSGIGKALAYKLSRLNVSLLIISRTKRKGERICNELLKHNKSLEIKLYLADISSLEQVRKVVSQIKVEINSIDILINNAGAKYNNYYLSNEEYELTFATNYLGHFLLTMSLLDLLKNSVGGRIINVSSSSHNGADFSKGNIYKPEIYSGDNAYRNSKLAIMYFTYELARILSNTNITVNAVDPGPVATRIRLNNGILPWLKHYIYYGFKGKLISASKAGDSILYLVLDENIKNITGQYFYNKKQIKSSPISYDIKKAKQIFELSLVLTNLNDFWDKKFDNKMYFNL